MTKKVEIEQKEIEAPWSVSGVEPYELPEGWKWVRLGDVADYINGRAFKPEEWEKEGKPIIRIQNLTNSSDTINRSTKIFEDKYLVKNDDLLYAWSASLGAYLWNGEDGWLNQHIFKVIPNNGIDKKYLYYGLVQVTDNLYSKTHGSGMVHVTLKPFLNTLISIPPSFAEQQRIVNRIESMFSKLDEAKEKAQSVVDSFETRKAAILHQAFTGKLTAKWRKENGVSDDSWEEKSIGECCTVVRGGSPRPAGDPKYYDGSIPFMKVADITGSDDKYVYSAQFSIKEAGLHKTRMVEPDTLLLTNSGATLGVPAITKIQTTFNDGIAGFLNLPKDSNLFFYYFWTSKTSELRAINKGAAQPNLNIDIIKSVRVSVPTIAEQQAIVHILDTVLEKERTAKSAAEQVLDQIDLLKKSILAKAFRGEL